MAQLNTPIYRRDYTGEIITYADEGQYKSLFVTPRTFPFDRNVKNAIVLGNGLSRLQPEVQLLLNQNNARVAEGYKTTYACNAAYRDTLADYYIFKTNSFFSEHPDLDQTKVFLPNNLWIYYRFSNLIPYIWYMDSGATAAYMAAFDGSKKVFLFGFDGNGEDHDNVYYNTVGYPDEYVDYSKHQLNLFSVVKTYSDVQFYRIRTEKSHEFIPRLKTLSNYTEVSVRDAVLIGDF